MTIWPRQVTTQQTEITFCYEMRELRESAPRFLFDYLTNTIKNTKASQGFYISPSVPTTTNRVPIQFGCHLPQIRKARKRCTVNIACFNFFDFVTAKSTYPSSAAGGTTTRILSITASSHIPIQQLSPILGFHECQQCLVDRFAERTLIL
jgi:hypothetical protein